MLDRMIEPAEGPHEIRKRDVAVSGRCLRACDFVVDHDVLVIREVTDEANDLPDQFLRRVAGENEVAYPDRAGIDEGVARLAALMLELDDRIEGRARRLCPTRFHMFSPCLPSASVSVNTLEIL